MLLSGLPNSATRHIILPRDRTRITRLPSRWLCAIFPSSCVYTVLRFIWDMERDFPGFAIEGRRTAREDLAKTNEAYVKQMAPKKILGRAHSEDRDCKRKVLHTHYLACLHRPNVELIPNDAVEEITEDRVRTKIWQRYPRRRNCARN